MRNPLTAAAVNIVDISQLVEIEMKQQKGYIQYAGCSVNYFNFEKK
mgnify:CR=1 FL=1